MSTNNITQEKISQFIKLSTQPARFGESPDDLSSSVFNSSTPIQHSHSYFECDEQGLYIGLWDTTDMVETAGPYECDEFMVILEGSVDIKNNKTGTKQTVSTGESFIIPQGYDCQWHQQGYLRKFYVIYEPPTRNIPTTPVTESIIKISSTDMGTQYQHKNFISGVKAGNEINEAFNATQGHYFCYLTQGKVQMKEANGLVTVFKSGDAFFVPPEEKGEKFSCKVAANTVMQYVEIKPL